MANERSQLIEDAFNNALAIEFEDYKEGDMLVEWVIIGFVASPTESTHAYPMLLSNGNMPTHHARGLLQTGLKMLGDEDD